MLKNPTLLYKWQKKNILDFKLLVRYYSRRVYESYGRVNKGKKKNRIKFS